jgi:hypothetical protein
LLNVLKVPTSVRAAPAVHREWRAAFPAEIPVTQDAAGLGDYSDDSSGLPGAVPVPIARPGGETECDGGCFGKQASESVSAGEFARRPATITCRNDPHAL